MTSSSHSRRSGGLTTRTDYRRKHAIHLAIAGELKKLYEPPQEMSPKLARLLAQLKENDSTVAKAESSFNVVC